MWVDCLDKQGGFLDEVEVPDPPPERITVNGTKYEYQEVREVYLVADDWKEEA